VRIRLDRLEIRPVATPVRCESSSTINRVDQQQRGSEVTPSEIHSNIMLLKVMLPGHVCCDKSGLLKGFPADISDVELTEFTCLLYTTPTNMCFFEFAMRQCILLFLRMGYQGSASVVVLWFGVRLGLASTKQHRTEQKVIP
jgi:hypothetical protein